MAQLQTIPSSISINHTQKENQNPSTVIYSLKNNHFLNLLKKVSSSQTQSSQSEKSSDHQMLNMKGISPFCRIEENQQQNIMNDNNRVLRFSQLQKINFRDMQQSQSDKSSNEQNNNTDYLTIEERFMSQTKSCKKQSEKKLKIKEKNSQGINWKLFTKQKFQKNYKSPSKNKVDKQKHIENINHFSLNIPTQPNKFYKKSVKQTMNSKSKDSTVKKFLMKQIVKNKQLEQKLYQTKKQNIQLREIIFEFNKKSANANPTSNSNVQNYNPSIQDKLNYNESKQRLKGLGNRSKSKQSKQNVKKVKEMRKQIVKLQQILTKLSKNIDGIQLKERKMKVSSTVLKSKHRFKTEAKEKTMIE